MEKRETLEYLKAKYKRLLMTQLEVQAELGISNNTLIKVRKQGELKSRSVGGKVMINIGDLADFMHATA